MKKKFFLITILIAFLICIILKPIDSENKVTDLSFKILDGSNRNISLDLIYSAPHSEDILSYNFSDTQITTSTDKYFPSINDYLPNKVFEEFQYTEQETVDYGQVAAYLETSTYQILALDGWRSAKDNIFEYTVALKENDTIKNISFQVMKGFTGYDVYRYNDLLYLVGSCGYVENDKFTDRLVLYRIDLEAQEVSEVPISINLPYFALSSVSFGDNVLAWSGIDSTGENVILRLDLDTQKIQITNTKNYTVQKILVNSSTYGFYLSDSGLCYIEINGAGEIINNNVINLDSKRMNVLELTIFEDVLYGVFNDLDVTNNAYIFSYDLNSSATTLLSEIEPHTISDIYLTAVYTKTND